MFKLLNYLKNNLSIANKAFKTSWSITWIALFIAGLVSRYLYNTGPNLFELFAWGSLVILILVEQYLLPKTNENNQFKKIILATVLLVFILIAIGLITR
ncbi:hypothetical protein JTF06_06645 [Desemzia sp. RIT804]|uniref:hypothetical protein n=1 Tax=Desemzia sp. RIT 804 TaxID=2810209 RepID=UPI001951720C|nr:hypothetical protein [Desemzia sp. RIT 804]MBM6614567.1 hypothetical protein [Desemzia sp. RIT 804]